MNQKLTVLLPLGLLAVFNLSIRPIVAGCGFSNNAIAKRNDIRTDLLNCQIYCYGPLLKTVQMAHLFPDSKTFVDMKLKLNPNQTMVDFTKFMQDTNNSPTQDQIRGFVSTHFDDLGKEFVPWLPSDWKKHPAFLNKINDPDLKQWGSDLNDIWEVLGRKMIPDVFNNPQLYSIIPVDYPVIVPGGRFIEYYYWDSYWIIRGLLYCEMYETARGMLLNFMSLVQRYGFIPNGGRVYYTKRSQPPLFAGMVKSYVDFTKDHKFAIKALKVLEREFEYWMNSHTVTVKGFKMSAYSDSSTGPRPESYREDVATASYFATDVEKEKLYSELKAAASSGMDFSSRWFINKNGKNVGNLTNLKTSFIVPVELNAILYWNAKIIAEFHMLARNVAKMKKYEAKAEYIKKSIQAVLWNEKVGVWLDYDIINKKPRNYFVPTNLSPLWTGAYEKSNSKKISALVLKYIKDQQLDKYPGGVPNTLYKTGEQWDYPNVWPPMQYILVDGLNKLGTEKAKKLSARWGQNWVKSNYLAYRETKSMFEKYNAETFGGHGGGGEYGVQKGFGWTNGVIIELLARYGRDLKLSPGWNTTV